jgi:membrane protein implicated in regulation of membrane protease activity
MDFISFRTSTTSSRPGGVLDIVIRLAVVLAVGAALVVMAFVGLFVVLPLMLVAGIASYFYLRRRVRQAQQRSRDEVIDAEYTIIDHRRNP